MLEHFYTDICAPKGMSTLIHLLPSRYLPQTLKRLNDRVPHGIPWGKITAFNSFGLKFKYRCSQARTSTELSKTYQWAGEKFSRKILGKGFGGARAVYAFKNAALDLMQAARGEGLYTFFEQISLPAVVQKEILDEECDRFPEWNSQRSEYNFYPIADRREKAEWECADVILCASEFTKKSVIRAGGPSVRCFVVPYGVDGRFQVPPRKPHSGPMRVLTVGSASLIKGAPYILAAAKALQGKAQFRIVGSINVSAKARARLEQLVELTGLVPRSEIMRHYAWADIFLFPSICDGFGMVLIEALSAGLPIITTPNTGVVIRDGIEGFIVPIRRVEPIVDSITKLKENQLLWQEMSQAALFRAIEFTLEAYKNRLLDLLSQFF